MLNFRIKLKMKIFRRVNSIQLVLLTGLITFQGCGIYSFTGTSIAADVESISIGQFQNLSGGGPPDISQTLTEKIRDIYQINTRLDILTEDGDLQVTGNIISYDTSPIAPQENETASLTRLTITVEVDFVNTKDDSQNFQRNFSFFEEFPQNQTLDQVEAGLIDVISDQIVLDIFNATVSDW